MYHHPPDHMLLCTHVDDFRLASSILCLAQLIIDCIMIFILIIACIMIANSLLLELLLVLTLSGIVMPVKCMYLSQATLIDRLLEQEFARIMCREHLTSTDLQYNPGKDLYTWEP